MQSVSHTIADEAKATESVNEKADSEEKTIPVDLTSRELSHLVTCIQMVAQDLDAENRRNGVDSEDDEIIQALSPIYKKLFEAKVALTP